MITLLIKLHCKLLRYYIITYSTSVFHVKCSENKPNQIRRLTGYKSSVTNWESSTTQSEERGNVHQINNGLSHLNKFIVLFLHEARVWETGANNHKLLPNQKRWNCDLVIEWVIVYIHGKGKRPPHNRKKEIRGWQLVYL